MRVMGLGNSVHWLSWFIDSFSVMFISCVLLTIILVVWIAWYFIPSSPALMMLHLILNFLKLLETDIKIMQSRAGSRTLVLFSVSVVYFRKNICQSFICRRSYLSVHKARNLWNKQNFIAWILEYEQHNDQHITNAIVLCSNQPLWWSLLSPFLSKLKLKGNSFCIC